MLVARKISWVTLFHQRFAASTIRFPSLGHGCLSSPLSSLSFSLSRYRRIIPCLFGTGHTDASLHFALALLLQVQSPHCYNGWPLLALLPVLLLLSLLLPVAADRRMEERRASCFVECRIRGKLHSLWSASSLSLSLSLPSESVVSLFLNLRSGFYPLFKLEISIGIGFDAYRMVPISSLEDISKTMVSSLGFLKIDFILKINCFFLCRNIPRDRWQFNKLSNNWDGKTFLMNTWMVSWNGLDYGIANYSQYPIITENEDRW